MKIGFQSPRHQGWFNAKYKGDVKAREMNPYPTAGRNGARETCSSSFEYLDGVDLYRRGEHHSN